MYLVVDWQFEEASLVPHFLHLLEVLIEGEGQWSSTSANRGSLCSKLSGKAKVTPGRQRGSKSRRQMGGHGSQESNQPKQRGTKSMSRG